MRKWFSLMAMIMLVVTALFMIPMVCMAQAADPGSAALSIDLADFLKTITSLTLVAWFLTELIGSLVGKWVNVASDYKKIIAITLTLILGLAARYTGLSFAEIPLLQFVVALVISAAGAQVVNDKIAKPLRIQIPARK